MARTLSDNERDTILNALNVAAEEADKAAENCSKIENHERIVASLQNSAKEYRELQEAIDNYDCLRLVNGGS